MNNRSKDDHLGNAGGLKLTFKTQTSHGNGKNQPSQDDMPAAPLTTNPLPTHRDFLKPAKRDETQAAISFRGLLAAQRISRNLKQLTMRRLHARNSESQGTKPTTIINPLVPTWSSKPKDHFPSAKAQKLIEEYLANNLTEMTYDSENCSHLIKEITEDIKIIVKKLTPPRYKLICYTTMGRRESEGMLVASRCLWDPYTDDFVAFTYQNDFLFCVVTVFTIYYE
ncbi:dynein light chain Tctex-type 5-like [Heterodontus francisci]|uniref:dynein light chain Tctex-type 5-like n=1 Tax=Heterodontus francisci TaxID=7792 RepID=UPI00355B0DC2